MQIPLDTAAALKVFACEPKWAALAEELGGDRRRHRVDHGPDINRRQLEWGLNADAARGKNVSSWVSGHLFEPIIIPTQVK